MLKTASQPFRIIIHAAILLAACLITPARGEISRGDHHFVIDGVKFPIGSEIEVVGPLSPGYAALHGMWIDGRANQDKIHFHLCRAKRGGWLTDEDFKALDRYTFYKIRGRIMEGRIYCEQKAITLVVNELKAVPARYFRFSDLVNRETTFEGSAAPDGILETDADQAQIANLTNWPISVAGKRVFVRGTLRKNQDGFRIEAAFWHLITLSELLDQNVSLEGILTKYPSQCYFKYKGLYLYLNLALPDEMKTKLNKLARDVSVRVSGRLVLENRPLLIFEKYGRIVESRDGSSFVIQEAKIKFLEQKTFEDERNKPIYGTFHPLNEGVPEVRAEFSHPGVVKISKHKQDIIFGVMKKSFAPFLRK